MEATDDVSYQKLLSNAWELRQTIARLTASLQDPQYSKNDKEDLEIALKATEPPCEMCTRISRRRALRSRFTPGPSSTTPRSTTRQEPRRATSHAEKSSS